MADQGSQYPQVDNVMGKNRRVTVQVVINAGSVPNIWTNCGQAIQSYVTSTSVTAPTDSALVSAGLLSGTTRIGFYLNDGRATRLTGVFVDSTSIQSPSMTGSASVFRGGQATVIPGATQLTGVTTSGNVAFALAIGSWSSATALTHTFSMDISYDVA